MFYIIVFYLDWKNKSYLLSSSLPLYFFFLFWLLRIGLFTLFCNFCLVFIFLNWILSLFALSQWYKNQEINFVRVYRSGREKNCTFGDITWNIIFWDGTIALQVVNQWLISWQFCLCFWTPCVSYPCAQSSFKRCCLLRFQKRIKLYFITVCSMLLLFTWFGCHVVVMYLRGNVSDFLWGKIVLKVVENKIIVIGKNLWIWFCKCSDVVYNYHNSLLPDIFKFGCVKI